MRAAIQAASGKAEEEPIAELLATTTTPPVVVWAPIRAAKDLRDTPLCRGGVFSALALGPPDLGSLRQREQRRRRRQRVGLELEADGGRDDLGVADDALTGDAKR